MTSDPSASASAGDGREPQPDPWYRRLGDREFDLHGTHFRVVDLDYHGQMRVLETLRVALGRLKLGGVDLDSLDADDPGRLDVDVVAGSLFQVVGLLTSDEFGAIRSDLYKGVFARMAGREMELDLSKSEHVVFAGRAMDSYTVTVRAFCVNFLGSWKESGSPLLDALSSLNLLQRPTSTGG